MGLVVLVLWALVFRAPLRDFSPDWLRFRLPPVRQYRANRVISTILLVVTSIIVGVATHLAWDSFTHPDGWLVLAVPTLQVQLGQFTLYRWAQYVSSAVGLVIVFAWLILWVRRTPPLPGGLPEHRLGTRARRIAWAAVAVPGIVVGTVIWAHGLMRGTEAFDRVLVFRTATLSISCAGLIAVVLALAWYLLPRQRARGVREQD